MCETREDLKFSILMPTFNGTDVISNTLRSVFSQTYDNYEIIINDDNSTDNTVAIIKSFKDKRIKLHKNERNLGYSANLNRCIKYAAGDIIYLMADDDIISHDAFMKTYNAFKLSDDIGAVCRPYRWFDEDFNTTVRVRKPLNPQRDEIVNITDDYYRIIAVFQVLDQLSGLAYRTKYLDRPFHQDIFPSHIYPFASIFKKHPVVFLKDYILSVSIRSSQCRSQSHIYDKSPLLSWVEMFKTVFKEKEFSGLRDYCIRNFVATNYIGLLQIKNYSTHRYLYTIREIYYLLKYRIENILNPIFWFFALGTLITPAFILRPLVDWYKNKINPLWFRRIKFEKAHV